MKKIVFFTSSLLFSYFAYTQTKTFSISADSSSLYFYQSGKIPLPAWVLSCNKIKEVNLSHQPDLYDAIEQLSLMDSVQSIIIQNAGIKSLPYNIYKIRNLNFMDLRGNYLQALPYSIRYCSVLESIDLDDNEMMYYGLIDIFKNVSKLRWLGIGNNKLDSIPREVCGAKKLAFLFISDNKIKKLPECVYSMQSLKQIVLYSRWTDRPPPSQNPIDIKEVKEEFEKNGLRVKVE